jgi:hypothetical protein
MLVDAMRYTTCDTMQCDAMRRWDVGRCRPGRGGRRRAARRGAGRGLGWAREFDRTRRGCWSAKVRRQGMDDMADGGGESGRVRIRRISPSSPSARPCSGPYSRIANVGSAELGTMIQSGDVKACSAQEVTTATTRGPNPHLARPVFAANCCGLCRREQHQQHRHSARPRSLHHS